MAAPTHPPLTGGAIVELLQAKDATTLCAQKRIVLQLIALRPMKTPEGQERYRVILSDGITSTEGMFAHQHANVIASGAIKENSVFHLKTCTVTDISNRRIITVLDTQPLGQAQSRIGEPQQWNGAASTGAAAASAAPPNVQAPPPQAPAQPAYSAPPPYSAAPQAIGVGANQQIMPIKSLNPYQARWTIKARVTSKAPIREWNNQKGTGKLFSVDLLDKDGGEIRGTAFNEDVDRLYSMLEQDKVYYISGGRLKMANRKFTSIKHEYEINFSNDTTVQLCDDVAEIPQIHYDLVPIARIADSAPNDMVDVMGIVINEGTLQSLTSKKGVPLMKRVVHLLDDSLYSIELTLWGEEAESFSASNFPVVAIKGARVSEWGGRTLSASSGSHVDLEPKHEQREKLRVWFDSTGGLANLKYYPLSNSGGGGGGGGGALGSSAVTTFDRALQQNPTRAGESLAPYEAEATIMNVRADGALYYDACPNDQCKRKVTMDHAGKYRCEQCDKSYDEPNPRLILSLTAADHTQSQWLSMFNDQAVQMLGRQPIDVKMMKENNDVDGLKTLFESVIGKMFRMRVRAKAEEYQGEVKVKHTVTALEPIDHVKATREILGKVEEMLA